MENRHRVDPGQPTKDTGIYRDKWECNLRSEGEGGARLKDAVDGFNYLSYDDWAGAQHRAIVMRRRRKLGEHLGW
jgi:hypothetical protein